jgi:hypothetical protein
MSVQLILYPQRQITTNEYVVNGITFNNFNNTTVYSTTAALPDQDAIINSPPTIVNTWFRYRTSGSPWAVIANPAEGAPPVGALGEVVLFKSPSISPTGRSGFYQKLSSLIIGQSYTVNINISATVAGGTLRIKTYTGNILQSTYSTSALALGQITTNFTANSTGDTILIEYEGIISNLRIDDISILGASLLPEQTYEGQVICDLYEDEDIPLSLSVDNFKNVAEKVQSYSKGFKLPATKRNNQIFTNLFEVTMVQDVYSFNPYIKTPCVLKQNGFIIFEGYLRLIDIQDKEAEISYNVNLYSEVIALADVLQNRTFQDIDFSELNHIYIKGSIKESWDDDTGLPLINTLPSSSFAALDSGTIGFNNTNVLKYPFVDWAHDMLVGNGATGNNSNYGFPELTTLEQAFRPFIQLKYLINRIFANTEFTWTSTFFDSADFEKLFMDFNWGGDGVPTPDNTFRAKWKKVGSISSNDGTGSYKALQVIPTSEEPLLTDSEVPTNFDTTTYVLTATTDNEIYSINYNFRLERTTGTDTVDCRWIKNKGVAGEQVINEITGIDFSSISSVASYSGSLAVELNNTDTLSAEFNGSTDIRQSEGNFPSYVTFNQSSNTVTTAALLALRGELSQWDFLKGIMTMFNLVSMPDKDNPNNINFEPYSDVFITDSNIVTHDWTDKVDITEIKLTPLTELNRKTIFKFVEEDDDYVFNVYKQSVGGHLYGSKVFDASGLTLLTGTDEIVAEPFAATISKPLMPQFPDFIVPTLYSMNEDGSTEGFDNAPRILYNNGVKDTGIEYYIPDQNCTSCSENQPNFLQFSHLSTIPTDVGTLDFHFGECQLIEPIGEAVPDNLFNLYWLPYYNELYNSNTRTMSLKVNLDPSDISVFKFNDRIFIKNREYRVNNIQYKPNDLATVEFILIP